MPATGPNEKNAEGLQYSPVDAVDSQNELKTKKPKRSSWGATLLTIWVGLCILTGVLYTLRTGDAPYAIGACLIPFICWLAYFRRHYFTKAPVPTDGWSVALVIVGILAASGASRNLVVKSPQEIVREINSNAPHDTENEQNARMRRTFTGLMALNKEAHVIDVEFENSYGGKNFLGTGCFKNAESAGVCQGDTQKALDKFIEIKARMSAFWKTNSLDQSSLQVAQYETMVTLFSDTVDLYRYASERHTITRLTSTKRRTAASAENDNDDAECVKPVEMEAPPQGQLLALE